MNEAIKDFRKAISLDERYAQSYNALGSCYLLMSSYKKAIRNFKISLNIEETNIYILKNLAVAYQSDKQFEKAADLMERHLLSYPLDSQARDIVALAYLNLKEYERCESHLRYQIDRKDELGLSDLDMARVLNNMGVVRGYRGKFEEAIGMYKASIQKYEESHAHIIYNNLLKTYLTLGKTEVAISILNEYTSKGLKNNSPFLVLANYYYENDEYTKSRDLLTSILERESDNVLALQLLSALYCDVFDDLDKSLELAKHAYGLRPSDQGLANNLAYYYVRKGLIREAKEILENRRWDKELFFTIATRGLIRLREGYVNEGTNLYNQAENLAWNTEWKRLVRQKKYVELGRYYLKIGKLGEAQRVWNRVLSTKSKRNIYRNEAGKLLTNLKQQQLM
jgi:tetratricopeptide (TPR) repeat protein